VTKAMRAVEATDAPVLVVAGGVGANHRLRARMRATGERAGVRVVYPRPEFCTDNAAMIALLGHLRLAAGEAFDKTAKLLGLGYPGGPQLAALAERGRSGAFEFPRPMLDRPGLDFSFSGLKTAVVVALRGRVLDDQTRADAALAFEEAVVETLVTKAMRAVEATDAQVLVVAGGVGANHRLRARMRAMGERNGVRVVYPRPEFCTDNAAMIALLGHMRLVAGEHDDLAIRARARWPMTELVPPASRLQSNA